VVPLSDGTLFVATASKDARDLGVDRVIRIDTHCATRGAVAGELHLADIASAAHDDHLIAETGGPAPHLVQIDRDGVVRSLDAPIPDRGHSLVGVRYDGSVLDLESEAGWRLLRAGPDHGPIEAAAGAMSAVIAVAPGSDKFALLERGEGTTGGALRVVELAAPAMRSAPVETHALAVGWTDDGRLLALLARGDATVLAVEGPRRVEHVVPAPSTEGRIVAVSDHEVAYVRQDAHTYVVVDLATGATRPLVDPSLGYTAGLSRSPRDGRLALFWNRPPRMGTYLLTGSDAERLPFPVIAFPRWSRDGDAIFVVNARPARIDRFDLATRTIAPYVSDLGSRGEIQDAVPVGDRDLFVHLDDPNSDVFAQTPDR
jgi:hypothetical protein